MKAVCRHCKRGRVNRPRGLCWPCYYAPGIRDLYPSTSKYARRGYVSFGAAPLAAEPTATQPGTIERVEVYGQRAKRGESIFHPRDYPHTENDT